jgi:hypothetical protein
MKISNSIYKMGRISRNVNAISKSIETKSLLPIIKRIFNIFIGRKIVSKLYWR